MNEYTFKLNGFNPATTLVLVDDELQIIAASDSTPRRIATHQITRIQCFDGIRTTDPESGQFESELCKITVRHGSPLHLRNCSYIRPDGKVSEFATNQQADYAMFLGSLMRQVAKDNPRVVYVRGQLGASIAWGVVSLLGVSILALGVAILFTETLLSGLIAGLLCTVLGGASAYAGTATAIGYWPKRIQVDP